MLPAIVNIIIQGLIQHQVRWIISLVKLIYKSDKPQGLNGISDQSQNHANKFMILLPSLNLIIFNWQKQRTVPISQ